MDLIRIFFENPSSSIHRQYEALRAYLYEKLSVKEVAKKYGYSENSLYCFASRFKKQLKKNQAELQFFIKPAVGRPSKKYHDSIDELIIELRKKYFSVPDIKAIIDTQASGVSETYIFNILKREGFARLPRRSKATKAQLEKPKTIDAPRVGLLNMEEETFSTTHIGLL